MRKSLRIGGSSSTTRTRSGAAFMRRRSCGGVQALAFARDRQADGEGGASAVGAVGRDDSAVHRFDEAARDREAKAGAGAHLVGLLRPVELVEDVLEVA